MRSVALPILALGLLATFAVFSQQVTDRRLQQQLKQLFPEAVDFTLKQGAPPHFKALGKATAGGEPEVLGLAWWTTEVEPLERGYGGPIKMLVGMDTKGVLRGIVLTQHREPYGDFSIDLPKFAAQFEQKNIRDPFRVGADVDAVSTATITVSSAARVVRSSARRIAREFLQPPAQ